MYLGVGTAKPNAENPHYKLGLNQALLIFVQEQNVTGAKQLALEHLQATGWQEVVIDKIDPIDPQALTKAPQELMIAYDKAVQEGSHGMVLETPKSTQQK